MAKEIEDKVKWLQERYIILDEGIREYNDIANSIGADLIVALTMTPEEFTQGMNELMEEIANESESDNTEGQE